MAVGLRGEHDAGSRRLAVEENRARAAHAVLASDMRAGQAQILAEKIAQQKPRLDVTPMPGAIDGEFDTDDRAHEARSLTGNDG